MTPPSISNILNSSNYDSTNKLPSLADFDEGVKRISLASSPSGSSRTPASSWAATSAALFSYLDERSLCQSNRHAHHTHHCDCRNIEAGYLGLLVADPSQICYDPCSGTVYEGKTKHINQKYTVEQGDFIIYALHDREMKWQQIEQAFAAIFGCTPKRTMQGLQAWYYRMNQKIPLWNQEGFLIFASENDTEPLYTSARRRTQQGFTEAEELPGLAQRYPERAVKYPWVDAWTKRLARDWGEKRTLQYSLRRNRNNRSAPWIVKET